MAKGGCHSTVPFTIGIEALACVIWVRWRQHHKKMKNSLEIKTLTIQNIILARQRNIRMKCRVHIDRLWLVTFMILPAAIYGQEVKHPDSSQSKLILAAAKEIMTSAATCALITLDEGGRPRVRAMDPFEPDSNFVVWFGTNPHSRKVKQIENDARVTLYYLDQDVTGYVMLHGQAQIVNDPEEKAKRWKEEWIDFYPDRPEGYTLIRVTPQWMEVISESRSILGDTLTWQPPVYKFNDK